MWWHVSGRDALPLPIKAEFSGKPGPDVRKAGELPLPTTKWNTWEYRLGTLLGQDNKTNPIGRGLGKPVMTL